MTQDEFDALPFLLARGQVGAVLSDLSEFKIMELRTGGHLRTWKVDALARWHRYLKCDVARVHGHLRMSWAEVESLPEFIRLPVVQRFTGLTTHELVRATASLRIRITCYGRRATYRTDSVLAAIGAPEHCSFGSRSVDIGTPILQRCSVQSARA